MKWFILARTLGMSVRRAQKEIDSYEFAEWSVVNQMDPSGEVRSDIRNALNRQTMYLVHAGKNDRIPSLKDLMLDYEKRATYPKPQTVINRLQTWFKSKLLQQEKRKKK